jgi:hypothetical protein
MKMIAEYLEHAIQFEKLAEAETDEKLKASLLDQARAYRKLADEKATRLNLRPPLPSSQSTATRPIDEVRRALAHREDTRGG